MVMHTMAANPGALLLGLAVWATGQDAPPAAEPAERGLETQDVARIEELYRLTDALGDALWPGFDTRALPIAVNHDDREEMLFAHPSPPAEFHASDRLRIGEHPVLVRSGVTQLGPRGAAAVIQVGGQPTAYASTLQPGQATEDQLSALLHESFHVFQRRFQPMPEGGLQYPPDADAEYSARIGLESRILQAMLAATGDSSLRGLGRQFVAVRRTRCASLSEEQIRFEAISEFNEGTASYVQARLYELLAERGGMEPAFPDPHYGGFADAARRFAELTARITPPDDALIDFLAHGQYLNGMGLCLVLDRLRPGWKEEMAEPGRSPYQLLDEELGIGVEEVTTLRDRGEESSGFEGLLAAQKALLEKRFATIRVYLDAPGLRYRIHHSAIPGSFDWDCGGPVYEVPQALIADAADYAGPVTVWVGGILRFTKGALDFTGKPLPMIFRYDYIEWIDPEPESDGSDLHIDADEVSGDVYKDFRMETDGFVLTLPEARILTTSGRVDVYPVVEGN